MRNIISEYQNIATKIWESDPTYSWDDRNNTDQAIASRSLSNASGSYLIPTTALRIRGIEIKDANGDFTKLDPIEYSDLAISPDEYMTTAGLPTLYMIEGTQIRLFPAPGTGHVTMASGMVLHISRAVTEPAVSATTTEPGFATAFHRLLSYQAALDFVQDKEMRQYLLGEKLRLQNGLIKFYSKWAVGYKPRLKPAGKRQWRLMT